MSCCCEITPCAVSFYGKSTVFNRTACGTAPFSGPGLYKTFTETASGSITCTGPDGETKTLSSNYSEETDYSDCEGSSTTTSGSTTESQAGEGCTEYSNTSSSFPFFSYTLTEDSPTRRVKTNVTVTNCEVCSANVGTMTGTLTITAEYSDEVTRADICGSPNTITAEDTEPHEIGLNVPIAAVDVSVSTGIADFSSTEYWLRFDAPATCYVHAEWDEVIYNADSEVINTIHRSFTWTGAGCASDFTYDGYYAGTVYNAGIDCEDYPVDYAVLHLENLEFQCLPAS